MKKPKITAAAMKVIKAYERKEYHNKRLIEKFFVDTTRTFIQPGKCLKLTGLDYNNYIKSLFPVMAKEAVVVEKEPYIFYKIYQAASKCKKHSRGRVKLIQDDAINVKVDNCVYVDLDIMRKLPNVLPVVRKQIESQRETVEGLKSISFTASIRSGGTTEERFDLIQEFLYTEFDAELLGFNGKQNSFGTSKDSLHFPGGISGRQNVYIHQKTPNFVDMGDIVNFQFLHYSDSAPYLSALIIYR